MYHYAQSGSSGFPANPPTPRPGGEFQPGNWHPISTDLRSAFIVFSCGFRAPRWSGENRRPSSALHLGRAADGRRLVITDSHTTTRRRRQRPERGGSRCLRLISRKPQRPLAVTALAAGGADRRRHLAGPERPVGGDAGCDDRRRRAAATSSSPSVASGASSRATWPRSSCLARAPARSASTTGSTSGSSSSAPADAVFARTTGHIAAPARAARAARHGGTSARGDSTTTAPRPRPQPAGPARSRRRRASSSTRSSTATRRKASRRPPPSSPPRTPSIGSARADLAQVTGRTHAADVAAARADVRRAQADLQALLGGTPAARRQALALAEERASRRAEAPRPRARPRHARPISAPRRPRSRRPSPTSPSCRGRLRRRCPRTSPPPSTP